MSPTNAELQAAVEHELLYDPRVDEGAIAVRANDGVVSLKGTVGSLREKFEAEKAAKRVHGVKRVDDLLDVKILDAYSRDDADLRGAVLQAFALNSAIPRSVDATAVNGVVTLTGAVAYQFEREEAESVASKVSGVASVENDIRVIPAGSPSNDLHAAIKKALERNADLDAANLTVKSSQGTVTLSGVVDSWANHDAAVAAAWAAPGVHNVEDEIIVDY